MLNKKHQNMKASILNNQVFCKKTVQIAKNRKKYVFWNYQEKQSLYQT